MKLDVLYFAWIRERIGEPREEIETGAETVRDLVSQLVARGERYEAALSEVKSYRVAVDQELVDFDHRLDHAREVAFFPPMTGG
ncbi:molybdopterin converting factor subunit 1 [Paracoccus aurantiacus]|uniref:Molybdopterin synthase sulfur carrier subunit n=1 Tax=Paracoccus aurantiacus TaxID=2599412 RepID=A0A5C6S638_9RHOB|nr:molybdopterin converting factor subunit 1 [Paracoccus aurantiacus]TXB69885.1 molybdopterin converting factor subunit 1 [Paracoccus aurantiacus]